MDKQEHIVGRPRGPGSETSGRHRERETEIIGARLWPLAEEPGEGTARPEWQDTDVVEASLLPANRRLYQSFPVAGMEKSYLRFMQHRIQRNPRDLLSHVRRVMAEDSRGDRAGTHGALLDLFLILGERGRELRHRLLKLVAGRLTVEQRRFFDDHLESGVKTSDVSVDVPRSRLSQQVAGTTRIVVCRDDAEDDGIDTVRLARTSIADGRDAHAQALLEGALAADPGDEAVCRELLALYKRKNLRTDMRRTYTASLGRRLALPELWRELVAEFRADDRPNDERS